MLTNKFWKKQAPLISTIFVISLFSWQLLAADEPLDKNLPIKIGFIAPLTGPFPEWGNSLREGMEIALEDTKNKFTVDYQDSMCDPKKTVTIAEQMLSIAKIKIIIEPGCLIGLNTIAPLAEQKKALLFSTGLLNESVFRNYSNVINYSTQISTESKYLASYIASTGIKKLSILHGTDTFGEEFGLQLPKFLTANDIQVITNESVDLSTNDFKSLIPRLTKNNVGGIFVYQGESQTINFMKQLKSLGIDLPIFSYYGVENTSMKQPNVQKWVEGLIYTFPVNSALNTNRKSDFDKRFSNKFGDQHIPTASSYYVYDGIMLLDKAMDKCNHQDTACIANFFKTFGTYEGISGTMNFKPNGSNDRPYGIKTIKDGKFIWLTKNKL